MKLTAAFLVLVSAGLMGCGDSDHHHHHKKSADTLQPTAAPAAKVMTAGAPMTVTSAPVPVSAVLASPEKYSGQPIKIAGNVSSVCEKKGCWARLTDDKTPAGQDLFVKFDCPEDDNGRILPLAAKGNPAVVEGTVTVTEISEAKARHYAKDAGQSEAEIAKIVGPQKQVTVASPSVRVEVR